MKVALLAPHMFMHKEIVHQTIFAPGKLVIDLAQELSKHGVDITFVSPNYQIDGVKNLNADLSPLETELKLRGYGVFELLQKHPLLFATLSRQIQAELIAETFKRANVGEFDLVHVYMNEEEIAMIFADLCTKPVIFTHHEPFNFLTKYRTIFPKYSHLNWLSISLSQRKSLGENVNWIGNIYHGIDGKKFVGNFKTTGDYFAYFGRIIEPKGVHLAIKAAKLAGVKLKIAGKHYSGEAKDSYWTEKILPEIDGEQIEYVGFISEDNEKEKFLGNAKALFMSSTWDEPFGVVMVEAMACGTPIIGFDSGAIPELIQEGVNGFVVNKVFNIVDGKEVLDEEESVRNFASKIPHINSLNRLEVRKYFESNFTLEDMTKNHIHIYKNLLESKQID